MAHENGDEAGPQEADAPEVAPTLPGRDRTRRAPSAPHEGQDCSSSPCFAVKQNRSNWPPQAEHRNS